MIIVKTVQYTLFSVWGRVQSLILKTWVLWIIPIEHAKNWIIMLMSNFDETPVFRRLVEIAHQRDYPIFRVLDGCHP